MDIGDQTSNNLCMQPCTLGSLSICCFDLKIFTCYKTMVRNFPMGEESSPFSNKIRKNMFLKIQWFIFVQHFKCFLQVQQLQLRIVSWVHNSILSKALNLTHWLQWYYNQRIKTSDMQNHNEVPLYTYENCYFKKPNCGKDVEQNKCPTLLVGKQNGTATWENSLTFVKLNTHLP